MMNVFVVTGLSESGDRYGPIAFAHRPTEEQLSKWAHDCDGDEDKEGPGYDGSWVDVFVDEVEIRVR